MNILLIAGGWSSERPVSLSGAQVIEKYLAGLGHKVTRYDPEYCLDDLPEAVKGQDFAFINLHGAPGEDGLIQAMLERLGCPYQGSGPAGSLLALDKTASKVIFKKHGIPTPDWRLLHSLPDKDWRPPWPCPVFVKSNTGGSSLGLARVDKPEDLHSALRSLFAQSGKYLIEPAVKGREVTCGVLADLTPGPDGKVTETPRALPPILILPKLKDGGFFDYSNKYSQDGAEEICPAPCLRMSTPEFRNWP